MNIWNHQFFGWYFGKLMISYTYSFWPNLTFSLFQIILLQFKIAYLEFITKRTSCTGVWRIFQPIHKTVPTENFQSHSLFWLEQFWVIFSNCLPAGIIHLIQLIFIGMIKILPTHTCAGCGSQKSSNWALKLFARFFTGITWSRTGQILRPRIRSGSLTR